MLLRFSLVLVIFLLVDIYFYQAVLTASRGLTEKTRLFISYGYWGFSAFMVLLVLGAIITGPYHVPRFIRTYLFAVVFIVEISKVLGVVFIFFDDLLRALRWMSHSVFSSSGNAFDGSRLSFINRMALLLAALPFSTLVYGMIKGAYDYRIRKLKLSIKDLPKAFEGLRIVQISDLHSGSFGSPEPLEKAFGMIKDLSPDVIFFTGDLVNDHSEETTPFLETYKKLQAPMGVFSILGNHDYGDYVSWPSAEAKKRNLEQLIQVHHNSGWTILNNTHHILEKDGEQLAILGVENWGANLRFPKYGKLEEAYRGTESVAVKLLLSHDPSHWDAEVRKKYPDIQATFSGHTHGMQFGIEIPGFKWSPVQYFYKQWAGLYREGEQFLYVNRGLGFIGYPGRVGIMPEITCIELVGA